ncbi:tripartite tricarboxylate transporter substrate-binding protein [Acidovorax sp. SUPP1855]|uniref:Bug family tripartite tricarboxylate transporter substrate binding protein n=1 Tax=Acidovorax sp. SUPP1855 TaxID=431774 RepID=UPI0024E0EDCA|nr:tripartite tricarboxylate transporter substrate-binding protein [Acidovorax sp. SUPP1855]
MRISHPAVLSRRRLVLSGSAAAVSLLPWRIGSAQSTWPTKPLRLVVPFAPGGSSEIVARAVAAEMSKTIGQNVFVDNKPGAAGNIAMQEVANSTDEHTLILGHIGTLAVNPYIFPKLAYDANRDFAPITLVSKVPSRGTGPMLTDLMAGRLQAAAVGAPALLPFIKAGKLRCIATGTAQRLPQLPDVPTVAEQGFKGFEMTQWYGLMAPSKWPKAHLAKLETEAVKAARSPLVKEKLSQETALAVGNTSAEFDAFIKSEQARWKPVIARAQIKPEGMG